MTGEERALLRRLLSEKRREMVRDDDIPKCSGCLCELDSRTVGCRNCMWRHGRRKQRGSKQAYLPAMGQGRRTDLLSPQSPQAQIAS